MYTTKIRCIYILKREDMYKSVIYVRSSKYDEESENSCVVQERMARLYAESKPDIVVKVVCEDNGYSGLDFLRPGFIKMMEELEKGNVNCIIVKDLSRLGRDYIQLGVYMEYIWPKMGVRVISISDGYDSEVTTSVERYFMVPMRNYINDMYSRDISIKVRSSLEARRKEGICTVSKVAYGYRLEHFCDKNKIVVDKEIEPIIKRIYDMSLEGHSLGGIAKILNREGIVTPMERRKMWGEESEDVSSNKKIDKDIKGRSMWYSQMVKRILIDEVYIGVLVQGKTRRVNYKIKESRLVEDKKRYKVYNHHQAIIDKRTFEIVNRLLKYDTRCGRGENKTHNLGGILVCGQCGRSMVYRRGAGKKKDKYICGMYNKSGKCKGINIEVDVINNIIIELFKRMDVNVKDDWSDKKGYIKREKLVYYLKNIYLYEHNKLKVVLYQHESIE